MRLLRIGEPGAERPAVLDAEGTAAGGHGTARRNTTDGKG
jgi:hypothetical protein